MRRLPAIVRLGICLLFLGELAVVNGRAAIAASPPSNATAKAAPVNPAGTEPPVKIISIEGVTEYRLANGARVLLFPEASRPTVTVNMTVLVGSRY
jgi:hypothetical protein